MKLKNLSVQNFRGITSINLPFDPKLTVLIGKNGAGKTTILDALALLIAPTLNLWDRGELRHGPAKVKNTDFRYGVTTMSLELQVCFDGAQSNADEASFVLEGEILNSTSPPKVFEGMTQSKKGVREDEPPLVVYYRQDRGFQDAKRAKSEISVAEMYKSSLTGDLKAVTNLEKWWDDLDAEEARSVRDSQESEYRDPQLEAVRRLIKKIDGFSAVRFRAKAEPSGLYFRKSDNSEVHVSGLSSGERLFLILLADLARRLQVTAPGKKLEDIPGIILIDEIELNLHPSWQSEIITTLRHVFRSCQFVVSTHSPQVLSAVESSHVRILDRLDSGEIIVEAPASTRGRTSNFLLEGVLHSTERFAPVDELIRDFNDAIDDNELKRAEQLLSKIQTSIEGDPIDLAVLRKRLDRLGGSK